MTVYVVTLHGCGECEPTKVIAVFTDRARAERCKHQWSSRQNRESQDDRPVESRDTCARSFVEMSEHKVIR